MTDIIEALWQANEPEPLAHDPANCEYCADRKHHGIERIKKVLAAAAERGYAVVKIELDEAMLLAGHRAYFEASKPDATNSYKPASERVDHIWRAMIAAGRVG